MTTFVEKMLALFGDNKMGAPYNSDITDALVSASQGGGGSARAVVPTADGLTTGLLTWNDNLVVATSANAAYILTLPTASAHTRGRKLSIFVDNTNNCELRTPDAGGQTINAVDSDGTQEALLVKNCLYEVVQYLDDGWLLFGRTALGAVQTAVVPD